MQKQLTHEQKVEAMMRVGLTRVQAERHLAAQAGKNVSDVIGKPSDVR